VIVAHGLTSGRSILSMSAAWLSSIIASTVASPLCSFQYCLCASLSSSLPSCCCVIAAQVGAAASKCVRWLALAWTDKTQQRRTVDPKQGVGVGPQPECHKLGRWNRRRAGTCPLPALAGRWPSCW
jgi:hypothetical protein